MRSSGPRFCRLSGLGASANLPKVPKHWLNLTAASIYRSLHRIDAQARCLAPSKRPAFGPCRVQRSSSGPLWQHYDEGSALRRALRISSECQIPLTIASPSAAQCGLGGERGDALLRASRRRVSAAAGVFDSAGLKGFDVSRRVRRSEERAVERSWHQESELEVDICVICCHAV